MHYMANRWELSRGQFRRRGNLIQVFPAYKEEILEIKFKNGKISELAQREMFSNKKEIVDQTTCEAYTRKIKIWFS